MLVLVNCMENAMSITFNEIQQNRQIVQRKYQERRTWLQEEGWKLYQEYIVSLSLPSTTWKDSNGVERQYVSIGDMNDKGLFQPMPLAALSLTDDYKLKFKISTVVDDSPVTGGAHYLVSIAMWKADGRLHVNVGDGKVEVVVASPDETGAFYEVSNAIKELILSGFKDSRLD
ncbi:hypothetical protein [Lelliottia wanjuensis]|uniref:hypothetical protein n=1 Tax=Lelliottia wanjuensis TaxID=3050585 RepID=UPI00254C4827|nr:hypothetical protein [Lelliottia sp. V106_16]MDK9356735.1 hypothetical protein [Lelliottia sp. V106_16]